MTRNMRRPDPRVGRVKTLSPSSPVGSTAASGAAEDPPIPWARALFESLPWAGKAYDATHSREAASVLDRWTTVRRLLWYASGAPLVWHWRLALTIVGRRYDLCESDAEIAASLGMTVDQTRNAVTWLCDYLDQHPYQWWADRAQEQGVVR